MRTLGSLPLFAVFAYNARDLLNLRRVFFASQTNFGVRTTTVGMFSSETLP